MTQARERTNAQRAYLDGASSAPLLPVAREAFLAALDDGWADPRRLHQEGRRARLLLDGARQAVAGALAVRADEVTFTATHARAVHAGVAGLLTARRRVGSTVVASPVEHSAVLGAASHHGTLRTPGVDRLGRVGVEEFTAAVASPGTALACLQVANGEVGTRQPVDAVGQACRAAGVPLFVDAGAAAGHVALPGTWDALTCDAGGWGGPADVGVLCLRTGTRWLTEEPEQDGIELVVGPPGLPSVLAAAVALEWAVAVQAAEGVRRAALVERIRRAAAQLPDVEVAGDDVDRLPHIVTFSCLYADGEALLDAFDRHDIAVGSGSACTAATLRPSHVLAAMGVLTHGNIRLGLPLAVPERAVEHFLAVLPEVVAAVRAELGVGDL